MLLARAGTSGRFRRFCQDRDRGAALSPATGQDGPAAPRRRTDAGRKNHEWVHAAAALYAGTNDIRNPLISPIHGDFAGLPPAIVTSGTRDLLISDAVRTHRKLRQAGIEAALQVFEA